MNEPEIVMYDDCFFVEERFGLWISTSKDREALVTSLTKEECIVATRFYLKGRQEGWSEESNRVINDGVVGGKL